MHPHYSFAPLDPESAWPAARARMLASAKRFGFIPSPVAKAARSPALLEHLLAGFGAFERSSLSPREREVVAFAVALEVGCHYCIALHSALLARTPDAELVPSLRAGEPLADPRLEALRGFTRALVRERGRVSDGAWDALAAAGFNEQQALDALLGAGVYWLSTVCNVVTGAVLDPPLQAFR